MTISASPCLEFRRVDRLLAPFILAATAVRRDFAYTRCAYLSRAGFSIPLAMFFFPDCAYSRSSPYLFAAHPPLQLALT